MHARTRLVLAGFAASLLLGLAVSSTSANRLSISNTRFRVTWTALNFNDGGTISVRCPVTIEGSFHSATIRKVPRALIGYVTRGIVKNEACVGGHATILQSALPWHLTYEGFVGTLPAIDGLILLLRGVAVQVEATVIGFSAICLYKEQGAAEENLAALIELNAAGRIGRAFPRPERFLRFFSGSGLCPSRGFLEGEGEVYLLGNTVRLTVTLI